jgi:diacylglycerol kinase family enzyme
MRSFLIVNPGASRVTPEIAARVESVLSTAGEVETHLTEGAGHAIELAERACETADRVFVLSGDGGYNEAVNGMAAGVPIGFLPGGGTSVLPRALGLSRDPVACARELAGSTRTRRISLGRVNGRRFAFAAGIGLDAELVRAVDLRGRRHDGRRPGDGAFALELSRLLVRRRGHLEPVLTVDGRGRAAAALVANCDPYTFVGRFPVHVAPEARFELGLDLVAPVRIRGRSIPVFAWWVLARPGQMRSRDVLYAHDVDELTISCDRPTPLQVDGEDLGDVADAHFESERDALDVVVGGQG